MQLAQTENHLFPSTVKDENKKKYNWQDFLAGLTIILREGAEALLIIVSLLALCKNVGLPSAYRWIHAGWFAALIAGGVSFLAFEKIFHLTGAQREVIEAICTGCAAILLFYTGLWLLSHNEKRSWDTLIKKKTFIAAKNKNLWSLFAMSFIAVYREAAETILFYTALYSSTSSSWSISLGWIIGIILLGLFSLIIFKWQIKLPLKEFFKGTSWFMVALSIIFVGKSIFELIEAGYISPTPLKGIPHIHWLGVYPVLETLLAQALTIGLVLILTGATFSLHHPPKQRPSTQT